MTGVSEMAQKLISVCEEAMTIISCANTEGDAHVAATTAFDEAASSLGELGFVYEVTRDGVAFSRPAPDVEEYDPTMKIGAAPFLVLNGTVELGTLDRVIDVAEFKALGRCMVIVCPNAVVPPSSCAGFARRGEAHIDTRASSAESSSARVISPMPQRRISSTISFATPDRTTAPSPPLVRAVGDAKP
jgi:hypothetical protein